MRVVLDMLKLKSTIDWLRKNDKVFESDDKDQAFEKLSANLKRVLKPLNLEEAIVISIPAFGLDP